MSIVSAVWTVLAERSRVMMVRRQEDGWMVTLKTIRVLVCTEGEGTGELTITGMWEIIIVGEGGGDKDCCP